jgi:membrane peptidoglycan carboxypeptidase
LASDGSELAKIVPPEGNRVDVNIDQVPVHVRQAVIAAEDRNFYSNPGFSFTGFARAFKNNIFGGDTQGGSTITQQYVKNALVGAQRAGIGGLVRKAKELVIATKMTGEWSKDDVLQAYLNIIYFGRGAYGISAASQAYFGKPVEQLTIADGALLAALIQRPSTLDPAVNLVGAQGRWNWVLDGMVDDKALEPKDRAAQQFPPTVPPEQARQQNQTTGPNGLIQRQVTKELLELFNIDEQTLNTQGLQITTTIDPTAQKAAENAVAKYLAGQDADMRTAVVSIDPHNGAVKAGRVADGVVVQGVRVDRRARAGHRPGLPGGQLTADGQRHQDHQRRGRRLRGLQHRRGAQAFVEHLLLPVDAEAEERSGRRGQRRTPGRYRG